jgi:hypothetical protein
MHPAGIPPARWLAHPPPECGPGRDGAPKIGPIAGGSVRSATQCIPRPARTPSRAVVRSRRVSDGSGPEVSGRPGSGSSAARASARAPIHPGKMRLIPARPGSTTSSARPSLPASGRCAAGPAWHARGASATGVRGAGARGPRAACCGGVVAGRQAARRGPTAAGVRAGVPSGGPLPGALRPPADRRPAGPGPRPGPRNGAANAGDSDGSGHCVTGTPSRPATRATVPKAYRKCCVKCKMKCLHLKSTQKML